MGNPTTDHFSRCIYCLTAKGSFESIEHIFPESLGNKELILPKGYVCDKCNHGILSGLDSYLIDFAPIALLRLQNIDRTKKGKYPRANFQNMYVERKKGARIHIVPKDKTGIVRNLRTLDDGSFSFEISVRQNSFKPKILARALYKSALGIIAFRQGHQEALDKRYDLARVFILSGGPFPNNFLMSRKGKTTNQVEGNCGKGAKGTIFTISIYGLIFQLNLEDSPTIKLDDNLIRFGFACYSLQDR
jgi:hypothetical protein